MEAAGVGIDSLASHLKWASHSPVGDSNLLWPYFADLRGCDSG